MKSITYRIVIFLCLALSSNTLLAQINSNGTPLTKNYSSQTYNAVGITLAITQDIRGVMYFGNSQVILEYDGNTWKRIPVTSQQHIFSLATSKKSIIYVGGTNDIGKLSPDSKGQLVYQSLKPSLNNDSLVISRIWKTYSTDSLVYFCSFQRVFIYNEYNNSFKVVELPRNSFLSFLVDGKLFVGNYDQGLLQLVGDSVTPVRGGENFKGKDIFAILNWDKNQYLISTAEKGLSIFDIEKGSTEPFATNILSETTNNRLKNSNVYSATQLNDSLFAFGTRLDGVFVLNRSGEIVNHITTANGLQHPTVMEMHFSPKQPGIIWAALENGISTINIGSPIAHFSENMGLNGTVYDIIEFNKNTYAATSNGVFILNRSKNESSSFEQLKGISGEIVYALSIAEPKNGHPKLIAGTEKGLYEINYRSIIRLNISAHIYRITKSKINPNIHYLSTGKGIHEVEFTRNTYRVTRWFNTLRNQPITNIIEDAKGNLWCQTFSGIGLVDANDKPIELPVEIKDEDGKLLDFNNNIIFVTDNAVLTYNASEHKFIKHESLSSLYSKSNKALQNLFTLTNSTTLSFYEKNNSTYSEILTQTNNTLLTDTVSLRILPKTNINTAVNIGNVTLIGGQDGIFTLNHNINKNYHLPYHTIIRSVTIGGDSIVYLGAFGFLKTEEIDSKRILYVPNSIGYRFNSIDFTFSSPFAEKEEGLLYSWYLEGFNTNWSNWDSNNYRNYTTLSEGVYRFHVKTKNIYGIESEPAIVEFRILPPWYRTWWAYIIYVVAVILSVRFTIALYTRKLKEDKRRLEAIVKERTSEIVEQNKKIEQQHLAITDSIKYAKRIQTAVLPDRQTCDLFDYFIYFSPKDIVSGDFYWIHHFPKLNRLIVVAADCTGHGVPGAFMSMLGTSFLNEIVAKLDVSHSDSILNLLRDYIVTTLKQGLKEGDKDERKDGMDMALVSIDLNSMILEYSGANNPLVLIRNNELIEYKPDKMPIGVYIKQNIPFQRTEIQLQPGDVFYLFSDGYVDQFGGPEMRKYMKKRFKEYLLSIHQHPLHMQKFMLIDEMLTWMGENEQIDDQIIIGMKVIS